jgi:phage-related protein
MQIPGVADGNKFRLWARPRRRNAPINREWYYNIPIVTIEMVATDPRLYADTESSQAIALPSAGGGLTFNASPNLTFGAVSTGGEQTLNNAGTFKTSPVFKILGPVTDPRLINTTTDETWHWEGTVASGDFLTVDMEDRTVLLNGTASRYDGLTSSSVFWDLAPGDNSVQYRAAAFTASTATATWRSAWV